MILTVLSMFRYCLSFVFGMEVSLLFACGRNARPSKIAIAGFYVLALFLQILCWHMVGLRSTMQIYPIIVHLPLILFLVLFKRPWLISISSVLASYLCCQVPLWFGAVTAVVFGTPLADHIGYILATIIVFYFIKRYVANSVRQLMERSTRSCLLFVAVPVLYYLFDYVTTVYTDILYSGSWGAVLFIPSLICTFYFVFVLLYYTESQKQFEAQQERDIFASQLHKAQSDLDTMRRMQNNTMIYRHDMRHHLSLIRGYAADGDLKKIQEYLACTETDIDALTSVRYCENETVNLILSTFDARAKKTGVVLCTDVRLPKYIGINDTELCSLLSNALENAITAAAQLEDKKLQKVYLHAVVNNQKLVISTENAYVGKIEMDGELPKSKSTEAGHGFGIKSMATIVERYGGLYSFETEGGVFVLQILLPLTM